jgi:CRISPR-associated protein Cas1
MIKRTIEISGYKTYFHMARDQLVVEREGAVVGEVPIEDIGLLVVDNPTASYSHACVLKLLEAGAAVMFCGEDHMPAALMTPLEGNHLQSERLCVQIEASQPTKKRLWQQIVRRKIRHQAEMAESPEAAKRLLQLSEEVKSGDPSNIEAQAARVHWASWLGGPSEFRRSRKGKPPNNILNYGYMVLRAAVARAVVGSGLHPSLGLQHHNRYNAFSLADDLLEPYRPLVDAAARNLWRQGVKEVTKEAKQELYSLLTHTCQTTGQTGPVMVALELMTASLVRCLAGEEKDLVLPWVFPGSLHPDLPHPSPLPAGEGDG